ncbi:hypothetical protein CROQUDRAFT_710626 [Cronartium quercuum f. sp. fusiforme G11]|uniref:Protein kinase domain-containing protein n=1 Tax=Cronartium quercuum f. sp. fusiforme G11 TaxID=708437 RepID=A0A9P6NDP0_9BASI|nr:hypothetical protein CROQUDRAFT_710626 [Cronartium quercuum f. sp. fusiforme G11]
MIEAFKKVYLIQELMETDMHHMICTQDLSDDHFQYSIYQTLQALKVLHSTNMIHQDLKPLKLLLNDNCDMKVCDFGLAQCPHSQARDRFMTKYVSKSWYHAPKIMLIFKQYTKTLDVWLVGCILAEMLSSHLLFPSHDYHCQLTLILDVLDTPTLDKLYAINSHRSCDYIQALPFHKKHTTSKNYSDKAVQVTSFQHSLPQCIWTCNQLPQQDPHF